MHIKRAISLLIVLLAALSTDANAWFFFFIPGSVTGKIADAITGSEGENCVSPDKKVGDTFRSPNGNVATIKSLSGTSSRCTKPELPIRALVEYSMSTSFTSSAGINVPDGFEPQSLNTLQKFNGGLLFAKNNTTDSGIYVATTKRDVVSDMMVFATNMRVSQAKQLDDPQQSEIERLTVNGVAAWRFETHGKTKNFFGTRYTYLTTLLEGDKEIIFINAWTRTGNYENQKDELKRLAEGVSGIKTPVSPVVTLSSPASVETLPSLAPVVATPSNVPVVDVPSTPHSVATPSTQPAAVPAATIVRAPAAAPALTSSASKDEKLRELKRLNDAGLISKDIFLEQQRKILDDTPNPTAPTEDRSRLNLLVPFPR